MFEIYKIRRPLEEGPPACEGFARSFIFDLRLQWNHITALIFCIFTFWILQRVNLSFLMSHVSGPVDWFTEPKKTANRPQPTPDSGSGMTPESHENSLIFEPVSKATKAMKINPEAT